MIDGAQTSERLQLPEDWTEAEKWAWRRIAAGEIADFNALERESNPDFEDLDPTNEPGWAESRRLRAKAFLQRILTDTAFVEATPFSGARISGALVDDAPIVLEHARLDRVFWLEKSRILSSIQARNLRVDGEFSLEASFVAGDTSLESVEICKAIFLRAGRFAGCVNLRGANIGSHLQMNRSTYEGRVNLNGATVKGAAILSGRAVFNAEVNLGGANIGSNLEMTGSTFRGPVNLGGATVKGAALLRDGAIFNAEVNLGGANIGSNLEMTGSTFEGRVNLNRVTVNGAAFLRQGANFKDEVNLVAANIGSALEMIDSTFGRAVKLGGANICSALNMTGSTFEGCVNLNGAMVKGSAFLRQGANFKDEVNLGSVDIGSNLEMHRSTFEGPVIVEGATVKGGAFLSGSATFKAGVNLVGAHMGSLDLSGAEFSGRLDLTGARIDGEFRLGSARHPRARWQKGSALLMRNARCGALQDWWRSDRENAWPEILELEGFTYLRLGGLYSEGREADMRARDTRSYIRWLSKDTTFSPQSYEYLAQVFRESGAPEKSDALLYAGRERHRDAVSATLGKCRSVRKCAGKLFAWFGLGLVKWTIGYGLGSRYFRVLWWVGGLTALGAVVLYMAQVKDNWWELPFASLDALLPVITLDKAHEEMIFGDTPCARPYWVKVYFYFHKVAGWVLGLFLVAGLAGLTQRN